MNLTLGFSPCPNDTFLFDAMVHDRITTGPYRFDVILDDVEALNKMAFEGKLDITKLSYHAFAYLTDKYQMMPSGSALGEGVGPLLVVKNNATEKPMSEWTVAVPGEYTTANLLLKLAYPEIVQKEFMIFSDIENAVLAGDVDAGVLIHENRFTYEERGLALIADLGKKWETKENLPIPLGGIAIRRSLPEEVKSDIGNLIKKSTEYAFAHPEFTMPFVKENAQEMDPDVMRKHIALYVNKFTVDLGNDGKNAVQTMLSRIAERDKTIRLEEPWLIH